MSWFGDNIQFRRAMWDAHPKWARVYLYAVGVPAWLYLMIHQFAAADPLRLGLTEKVAIGLFASAALVQLAVLSRAFWKMDL